MQYFPCFAYFTRNALLDARRACKHHFTHTTLYIFLNDEIFHFKWSTFSRQVKARNPSLSDIAKLDAAYFGSASPRSDIRLVDSRV